MNSTDLGILLNNFGDTSGLLYRGGNLNDDMDVDSTDLGLLLNNFGFESSAATAVVPEPPGKVLLLICLGAMIAVRRRRLSFPISLA